MNELQESLKWKKFEALTSGFVCLVDVMGDDSSIVQAARVSYGDGTKTVSDDRTLIRYLMRHGHMTPFEMCEVKLLVKCPIDVARQWVRHRTASINEYSTRYSNAISDFELTGEDEWRLQATQNKQGSCGTLCHEDGRKFTDDSYELLKVSRKLYDNALERGVAREVARKYLPLATYTQFYWKCDLRNIFHFLELRMDEHAQKEIRDYANIIGNEIIKPLFPVAYEAFEDYCLGSVKFSATELEWLKKIIRFQDTLWLRASQITGGKKCEEVGINKRELDEFVKKLEKKFED